MNLDYLCMGCMKEKTEWTPVCPYCGYDGVNTQNKSHQLPTWTVLNNAYLVGKGLGDGGFGMTYMGFDMNLQKKVAIKEYYLRHAAWRNPGDKNVYYSNDKKGEIFLRERAKFVEEARILAQIDEQPGIVKVISYFEENQTAYIVMEFLEGKSLKAHLKEKGGILSEQEAMELMKPVIRALAGIHNKGVVHRDISPDNIMLTKTGKVKLIDFGAAKDKAQDMSSDKVFKNSYSPIEQRTKEGVVGPYSDVYALCATMYTIVTGKKVPPATDRAQMDTLMPPSALGVKINPIIEAAIINGLSVKPEDRIKNATDLYYFMYVYSGMENASGSDMEKKIHESQTQVILDKLKEENEKRKKKQLVSILSTIVLLCGIGFSIFQIINKDKDKGSTTEAPTEQVGNISDDENINPSVIDSEELAKYRDEMYELINSNREHESKPPATVNDKYQASAEEIVSNTLKEDYTEISEKSNTMNNFAISVRERNMITDTGYVVFPCDKAYTVEEIYNVFVATIADVNESITNAVDLSNCFAVGVAVGCDEEGALYWTLIYK